MRSVRYQYRYFPLCITQLKNIHKTKYRMRKSQLKYGENGMAAKFIIFSYTFHCKYILSLSLKFCFIYHTLYFDGTTCKCICLIDIHSHPLGKLCTFFFCVNLFRFFLNCFCLYVIHTLCLFILI